MNICFPQFAVVFLLIATSVSHSQDTLNPSADRPEPSPLFQAGVDKADTHQYTNFREPVVVRTKSGRLIVGVQAGNRLGWPERSGQDLAVRLSDDNGKTWSPIVVAAEHGNFSCQCHGLVYDAEINRVLFLYTVYNWDYTAVGNRRGATFTRLVYEKLAAEGKPFVTSFRVYSDDEGQTWSKPKDITRQVGRQAHFGASEGRQLTSGDHRGRLLLAGARMDLNATGSIVAKHPGVWRSDDHGETWKLKLIPMDPELATPRNASSEARITELASGSLLYNQRTRKTGRHLAWSDDDGETWTKTSEAADLKVTQCNGCTMTLEDGIGQLTDTVLFSIPSPGGRSNGVVYVSNDGGKTWPIRRDVVEGFFAYSALIQLDPDTIGMFYESNHYRDINFVALPWNRIQGGTNSGGVKQDVPREVDNPPACSRRSACGDDYCNAIYGQFKFLPDLPDSIYVFGGTTGRYILLPDGTMRPFADRPFNPRRVLKYDIANNRWSHIGRMPVGAIVTSAVIWNGQVVIPSGETKPGIRMPRVQTLRMSNEERR